VEKWSFPNPARLYQVEETITAGQQPPGGLTPLCKNSQAMIIPFPNFRAPILPILATALLGLGSASAANNFADAQVLTGIEDDCFVGDISAYSLEAGEPLHRPDGSASAGRSAWWRWTAPASGWVTVSTFRTVRTDNPVRGTTVGIYTGNAVNALTAVAKSFYAWSPNTNETIAHPRITFFATIGQTYHFAVDGINAGDVGASNRIIVFELRQFVPQNATHYGAINFGPTDPSLKGLVTVSRTSKNAYSASVALGGKTYRFRGGISPEGFAQFTLPSASPMVPGLQVELSFGGRGQVNVFNSINESSDFPLRPAVRFNAQTLNTIQGSFTHNLYPSGDSNSSGYGLFSINRAGRITGVMVLPDGVRVPWSGPVCDNTGSFEAFVYRPTFGKKGFVVGAFSIVEAGLVDTLTFGGSYFRPAGAANATFYAFGLDIPLLYAEGETYTPPAPQNRALGFLDGTNGAGFLRIFATPGENIPGNVDEGLTLSLVNTISFQDPVTNQPKLKLNPKNGLITGQINLPGAPKRKIQAVLYRNGTPLVAGFATGNSQNVGLTIIP
jgi:hypothetical protein